MVTFAQAQERAEHWVNGPAAGDQRREVRVREFDLGFVAWAEHPAGDGGAGGSKLVIARDSGDTTLWPALPVNEVIRRYAEEYGAAPAEPPAPKPPQRLDLEATSFLLTPPQWLQEAADLAGVPDQRPASPGKSAREDEEEKTREETADDTAGEEGTTEETGAAAATGPASRPTSRPTSQPPTPSLPPAAPGAKPPVVGGSPWMDTSNSAAEAQSVAPPATVFSQPVVDERGAPPPPSSRASEARTAFLPQRGNLPEASPPPAPPSPPSGAADLASVDTATAAGMPSRGAPPAPPVPPPPGAGTPPTAPDGAGSDVRGYVPTRAVPPEDVAELRGRAASTPPAPPSAPAQGGSVHQAATMFAHPTVGGGRAAVPPPPPAAAPPGPGSPGRPHAPGTPPPGPHPGAGSTGYPAPPGTPGTPPPGAPAAGPAAAGYGYPHGAQPTVGSGYMAVLRYRAADGSEQQLIRRSAPGTPHPEWQLRHELHAMNVPPEQVLELHTELQSCELPGGYCARLVRETWPQARVTHTAAYGRDHASRQAGVRHLVEHQDELQQFADGPPRSAPVRAPLPQVQPAPAVGLDVIGQELAQAFGPQAVFRYDQQAVSRQGVPEIVAQTLLWSGLPREYPPFFWAQAQLGRPVPTLAELALERGLQPAPDAGSYLVMGGDVGRQLCVQYGTACIVAVPTEADLGGQPVPPQFVNASLPQFVRCLALLGRMWPLRYGLNPEQAGRWTSDFQGQLAALDPQAVSDPESWWSVLLEQMWDGLL